MYCLLCIYIPPRKFHQILYSVWYITNVTVGSVIKHDHHLRNVI